MSDYYFNSSAGSEEVDIFNQTYDTHKIRVYEQFAIIGDSSSLVSSTGDKTDLTENIEQDYENNNRYNVVL